MTGAWQRDPRNHPAERRRLLTVRAVHHAPEDEEAYVVARDSPHRNQDAALQCIMNSTLQCRINVPSIETRRHSFGTVINARAKAGDSNKAMPWLTYMDELGVVASDTCVDIAAYSTLAVLCPRRGDWGKIEELQAQPR